MRTLFPFIDVLWILLWSRLRLLLGGPLVSAFKPQPTQHGEGGAAQTRMDFTAQKLTRDRVFSALGDK